MVIAMVKTKPPQATIPRGSPRPHTEVCLSSYRYGVVSIYWTVKGTFPAVLATFVTCHVISAINPPISRKAYGVVTKNTATATSAARRACSFDLTASIAKGTVQSPFGVVNRRKPYTMTRGSTRGRTLTLSAMVSPTNVPRSSESLSLRRSITWSMDQKEAARKKTRRGSGR